jgi:hypothetical protein
MTDMVSVSLSFFFFFFFDLLPDSFKEKFRKPTNKERPYTKGVQGNPRVSHGKQQKDRSRSESNEESQDEFTIRGEDGSITSGGNAIEVVDGRWKICRTHRMEWE